MDQVPITQMLRSQNLSPKYPFYSFSDSLWNDNVDMGRSTGGYIIIYVGGMVNHSSNLPEPVALSSDEAEYNEGCLIFMGPSHLMMILSESKMPLTVIYFNSKSAIAAMGASYKDTKHTCHIMYRYYISEMR
jgi:hypothetical protein